MPITPIDLKTNLTGTNEVSRMRDIQKGQELGATQQIAQNEEKNREKTETVRNTESAEHRAIREEDEDAERDKLPPDHPKRKAKEKEESKPEEPPPPIPDPNGVRGFKLDIKA